MRHDGQIEEWRPVLDWPSYEVSNHCRVRSLHRIVECSNGRQYTVRARILRPYRQRGGYLVVGLSHAGLQRRYCVQKLAREAFGPESLCNGGEARAAVVPVRGSTDGGQGKPSGRFMGQLGRR